MSKISMDEKLTDLKKVIIKLSEIGCELSAENKNQSAMLMAKNKHISDLEEQVNKLYADNNATIESNTELQRANAEFERENKNLSDDNEELYEKNKSLCDKISELERKNEGLKKEINKLEEQKGQKKSRLQEELKTAKERISKLEKQIEDKNQIDIRISSLLEKIGDIKETIENLKDNGDNSSDSENNFSCISDDDKDYMKTVLNNLKEDTKEDLFGSKHEHSSETSQSPQNPCSDANKKDTDVDNFDDNENDSSVNDSDNNDNAQPCQQGGY